MLDISLINVDVRFKCAENDEGGQRGNPGLSRSCKTKFNEAVAVRCLEEQKLARQLENHCFSWSSAGCF